MIQTKPLNIVPLQIDGLTEEENVKRAEFLERLLLSWEGTPYKQEWQIKHRGVDCVRFVAAIYDVLLGKKTDIKTLPPDASLHNRDLAIASMRKLLRLYPSEAVEGKDVQPGDGIICGPVAGGPGHALIVGMDNVWHCGTNTVCKAGLTFLSLGSNTFKEIRRLKDRTTWMFQ